MSVLVIAEHDNERLQDVTRNTVAAALQLAEDVHVLVAGSDCGTVADESASLSGVVLVRSVQASHYADQTAENLAALAMTIAEDYSHILAPASTFGKNLLPRLAALLDVAPVSDVIAIESSDTFVRPIYAGNALAVVKSKDRIKLLTIRTAAFDAVDRSGAAKVEPLQAGPDLGLSKRTSRQLVDNARPDLGAARVIVSGGRGLGSREQFERLLYPLADRLGAAMGATRAAVDAGFVSNECQIGQTGRIVAPQLYIAVGISGAIQHLAGMSDSKVIVAINKDVDAPIFQVADYGLVGDLVEVVPELTKALG